MLSENTKIQNLINIKNLPSIIYPDLGWIIEKTDGCKNNPENSSTTKVTEHVQSGI